MAIQPSWRTVVSEHQARKPRVTSRLSRLAHQAGKVDRCTVPDGYASTGNKLADKVRASIARDLLAMLPKG